MGILFLIIAACLWGALGPVSRIAFTAGLTPLETAFWRGTIAGMAYALHFSIVKSMNTGHAAEMDSPKQWGARQLVYTFGFGLLGVGLLEGSYVYAVHLGGAALASVLLYSAPIWVNLYSWRILREHIAGRQWIALTITFLGIGGVSLWGAPLEFSTLAIIFGLLSGFSYALFYVAGKYFFQRSHPVSVFMISFPIGSLALLPLIYAIDGFTPLQILMRFAEFPRPALFSLVAIGLFSTYLPYLFYAAGLKRIHAGRAAIVTTIEPVVAILLANLMWNEQFSVIGYLCCCLVLIGVILVR